MPIRTALPRCPHPAATGARAAPPQLNPSYRGIAPASWRPLVNALPPRANTLRETPVCATIPPAPRSAGRSSVVAKAVKHGAAAARVGGYWSANPEVRHGRPPRSVHATGAQPTTPHEPPREQAMPNGCLEPRQDFAARSRRSSPSAPWIEPLENRRLFSAMPMSSPSPPPGVGSSTPAVVASLVRHPYVTITSPRRPGRRQRLDGRFGRRRPVQRGDQRRDGHQLHRLPVPYP